MMNKKEKELDGKKVVDQVEVADCDCKCKCKCDGQDCKCKCDCECNCNCGECEDCDCEDCECDCNCNDCECEGCDDAKSEVDYQSMYQRALADQENARKRHDQDKKALREYACQSVIEDLLPVVDNFYRATDHVPAENKNDAWVTGIQYIQKQLLDVIESYGATEITTKPGDTFDPSQHEAVGVNHDPNTAEDCILEVQSRGYRLGKRVVRPAKVIVNKLKEQE